MTTSRDFCVIAAGCTGLIGNELIKQLLEHEPISRIYALSRRELPFFHSKLQVIKHPQLKVQQWQEDELRPEYGFICLGTTLKQAGSKQALEKVDFELVCDVAQEMKLLGVKRLAVVSSYGASVRSLSHYLRCKGRMELAIERLGFEKVVFVRPGPLKGLREEPRRDEIVVQTMASVVKPLMIGPLAKLIPIDAADVAKAMQYRLFAPSTKALEIVDSVAMKQTLRRYQ
ncbi:NAD(P)H-binding protein [Vibrio sp. JPW-9-11-11]|uniref:NAD(P)H-binding protein n=1 Tax=Vibrio sp. JPW-9-11-11 TaxID=1416532 RepID=UPI0020CBE067|nr:NAD(P)H-binding protein [Vibrio sp. JPW-9-11-11]